METPSEDVLVQKLEACDLEDEEGEKFCKECKKNGIQPTDVPDIPQQKLCRRVQLKQISSAIQKSLDKICGMCDEVIVKNKLARTFGILSECDHIFCFQCLRNWSGFGRLQRSKVSCPECKVNSLVCPSPFWIETSPEKEKLFKEFNSHLDENRFFNTNHWQTDIFKHN